MYPKSLIVAVLVLVLLVAGGLLWFFLGRTPSPSPSQEEVQPPSRDKQQVESKGEYHVALGYYPPTTPLVETAGEEANTSAVFSMRTFVESEVARFVEEHIEPLTADDIEMLGIGGARHYALEVDYHEYESDDTVSYVYHIYADTLGAHPNAYYRTFTFNKNTGYELHIGDLFVASEYLDALSELSRKEVRETLGNDVNIEYLESGTTPMWENFQHFYMEGPVLVIVFPPYQVGPWAIGTQEARISRSELTEVLKAEYR